jgi:hypothetical protein
MFFGESLAALTAAETSKPVPMLPKLLTFCLAIVAGHRTSPLVFLRVKPDNQHLGSECGLRPRLDSALPVALTTGRALSSTPPKSKRPAFVAANYLSPLSHSLQAGIHKSEWILNALKRVTPLLKRVTYLYCGHLLAGSGVENGQNKLRPCDFTLDLLPEGVLKPYLGSLQLSDFGFQLKLHVGLAGNLFLDFFKSFLERMGHWGCSLNTPQLYSE